MRLARGAWSKVILAGLFLAVLTAAFWLAPIQGRVFIVPGPSTNVLLWPQMRVEPAPAPNGKPILWVTDSVPWAHVRLTADGQVVSLKDYSPNPGGTWTWRWTLPSASAGSVIFYHDCHTGCVERGRLALGESAPASLAKTIPTKLGVVFANPQRDWHGRSGWDVELTYALMSERDYWGIDDLATRVMQAAAKGLRVLVRVDYAQGQSVPPADDQIALTEYLQYLQRLARDDRLRDVYGYVVGSNFNARDSNAYAPNRPVTPEWYARVFNGYGEPASHTDNAVQTIKAANPHVRVLAGPVQPWNRDQDGDLRYAVDAPWLNYMNSLVAALDQATRAKTAAGVPLVAADGFAIQTPGRPDAPELETHSAADEPRVALPRADWGGAQAGFGIYRDWLAIVNAHPTTRGAPLYVTATNTYAPDQTTVPAQNYARGWLTSALETVNQEPQIQALCWFLDQDRSGDVRWDWFSLSQHTGRLVDAAEELDQLLQRTP